MLDTVGFITNLPHGLVDCFKSTLDELHNADLLIHVRDISHPETDFQRKTVLKVMKEVGLPESLLGEKYMEVWNKIDLISDEAAFMQEKQAEVDQAEYPIVLMSAVSGYNKKVFLEEMSEMVS